MAVLATAAAALATGSALLARADGAVYDALAGLSGRPADPGVIIVAIDDRSLAELGRWPWPRVRHTALLNVLAPMKPKAVIYDVLFTEPDPADSGLAKAMAAIGNVFLPVLVEPGLNGASLNHVPPAGLAPAAAGLGQVIIRPDLDGVVRHRERCAAPAPGPRRGGAGPDPASAQGGRGALRRRTDPLRRTARRLSHRQLRQRPARRGAGRILHRKARAGGGDRVGHDRPLPESHGRRHVGGGVAGQYPRRPVGRRDPGGGRDDLEAGPGDPAALGADGRVPDPRRPRT
uniref:CHASE2 domain-containing protein n=1 Tax=Phenylobacterium glaciei TaxID=2803784 RepID=A0A974P205_9CAUL|nr:CHASE2 domain-containing protein [Phenylobacterium glaciei]